MVRRSKWVFFVIFFSAIRSLLGVPCLFPYFGGSFFFSFSAIMKKPKNVYFGNVEKGLVGITFWSFSPRVPCCFPNFGGSFFFIFFLVTFQQLLLQVSKKKKKENKILKKMNCSNSRWRCKDVQDWKDCLKSSFKHFSSTILKWSFLQTTTGATKRDHE
jgi:hypothetical protein